MSSWKPDDWVKRYSAKLASLLPDVSDKGAQPLMRVCSLSATSAVFCVKIGDAVVAVKSFDPSDDQARQRFDREAAMLAALKGTGLSPHPLAIDQKNCFVVMDWVSGDSLHQVLSNGASKSVGERLGTWFAAYQTHVATRPVQTDWFTYLSNYAEFDFGEVLKDRKNVLLGMPISQLSIAKNDAYLPNFIETPTGKLVGIDFEKAVMKPVGWDLLLMARTLTRALGDDATPMIRKIIAAWAEQGGDVDRQQFGKLTRLFLRALSE